MRDFAFPSVEEQKQVVISFDGGLPSLNLKHRAIFFFFWSNPNESRNLLSLINSNEIGKRGLERKEKYAALLILCLCIRVEKI